METDGQAKLGVKPSAWWAAARTCPGDTACSTRQGTTRAREAPGLRVRLWPFVRLGQELLGEQPEEHVPAWPLPYTLAILGFGRGINYFNH